MNLPDGFVLDQQQGASQGLPAGFTLDAPVAPLEGGFSPRASREADLTREQRKAAYKEMAAGALDRAGTAGDVGTTVANALGRVNPFSADMRAAASMMGLGGDMGVGKYASDYQDALDRTRAIDEAATDRRPVLSYGTQIAGSAALPAFGIAANTAKGGAALGAGYGAAYGLGSGDGIGDRATKAAEGAMIGGVAGGVLGKIMPGGASQATSGVTQAAERVGVDIPTAFASDSQAVQRAGQGIRNVPFAGEKMAQATQRAIEQITQALDNLASGLGSADRQIAGQSASTSIRNWITGDAKQAVEKAYGAVDGLINQNVTTPLSATQSKIADILAERQASRISDPGKAVSFVAEAVQDAKGLTFDGIKGLRTRIGEMLDNPSMLPSDVSKAELKRVYGALTEDLGRAAENAGGPQARVAWERANRLNQMVAKRREELAKIVGESADAAAEKVFARLEAMASTSSNANISLLAKARSAIGSDWGEVSSAVVANLGRDAKGNFTPDRFVTAYGKLSDKGKAVLFDKTTRAALDDIQLISSRMQEAFQKYGNPSRTAQAAGWGAAFSGLAAAPVTTISTLIGGNALASVLSKPATASSLAKWSRAYELAVTKPTAGTISALQIASRNLANTAADKAGVQIDPSQLMKALSGPKASHAQPDQEKQN